MLAGPTAAGIDREPSATLAMPVGQVARNGNGAIAQLGERYNGIVEVSGSIPLSSTNHTKNPPQGGFFAGRNVNGDSRSGRGDQVLQRIPKFGFMHSVAK